MSFQRVGRGRPERLSIFLVVALQTRGKTTCDSAWTKIELVAYLKETHEHQDEGVATDATGPHFIEVALD